MDVICPFCGHDPFDYVDNGVGMEAVAVTCCDLGNVYFRGARATPEEVTLSWEEFESIGRHLATLQEVRVALEAATDRCEIFLDTFGDLGDCATRADIGDWLDAIKKADGLTAGGEQVRSEAEPAPSPAQTKGEGA